MMLKRILIPAILAILVFSCKKDDGGFTRVKSIENLIYLSIKEYRETNGSTGAFVHQYLMVEEAQLYSYKMANGFEAVGTQGLDEHWDRLDQKYTFYNRGNLVLKTDSNDEAQIMNELLQVPGADSILLMDVTQCGVGVEADTAGIAYITVLLAKADS